MLIVRRFLHLCRANDGVVALEFALIAPVLLLLFFGADELAMALDCRARVTDASATTADLVAQRSSVSLTDMKNIFCATKAIINPYNTTGTIKMVVSGITCATFNSGTNQCTAKAVGWSMATSNATARVSPPDDATLPLSVFTAAGVGVVMVEMQYSYSPVTTQVLDSSMTMNNASYSIPRGASVVGGANGTIADCPLGT